MTYPKDPNKYKQAAMAKSGKKGKKSQEQILSGDEGDVIQIQPAKEKKKGKREKKATGLKI